MAARAQRRFQPGGERFGRGQAVTGAETVAEDDDPHRRRRALPEKERRTGHYGNGEKTHDEDIDNPVQKHIFPTTAPSASR